MRAYPDYEAIVAKAVEVGADAIYPGYGFLAESPDLAEARGSAGVIFVGPSPQVLELAGNKMRARQVAEAAGLPVLRQTPPIEDAADALTHTDEIGFPLFVKAAAGGGGRGLRRIDHQDAVGDAVDAARREAESAFGDPTVRYLAGYCGPPRPARSSLLCANDSISPCTCIRTTPPADS